MPSGPDGKISCNSRSPNTKEKKNIHGLNTDLIRAKRQSSYSQRDTNVITLSFSFLIFHAALERTL